MSMTGAASRLGRYAAIDIGTVTCRMLVADVSTNEDGSLVVVPVLKEYAVTNLGEGVDVAHRLSEAALVRVTTVIDSYLEKLEALNEPDNPVVDVMTVATSASRDADNADRFVAMLDARGLRLAVIPGEVEAALSFMGASAAFGGERVMVVDVGGGSTEVSLGRAGEAAEASRSFDIGCRRVIERFWDGYPPSGAAVEAARAWIRPQFEDWFRAERLLFSPEAAAPTMVAVAGTATSIVAMRDGIEPYDSSRIDQMVVTAGDVAEQVRRLSRMTLPEIEHVRGLDPKRGPVIVAGMVILQEVMNAAGLDRFTVSESDILEGMIMYTVQKNAGSRRVIS